MLIIRGVNVFPSEVERVLLQMKGLVPYYQLHLVRKGSKDEVELHVEIEAELYARAGKDMEHGEILTLRNEIRHALKSQCLVSVEIFVNSPKKLPRTDGKSIRVVDRRESGVLGV